MTINVNSELMEKKVDGMVCQTQNKHYKLIKILKNIVNIVSEGIFIHRNYIQNMILQDPF